MKVKDLLKQYYDDPYKKTVYICSKDKIKKKKNSYEILEIKDIEVADHVQVNALRHEMIIIEKR